MKVKENKILKRKYYETMNDIKQKIGYFICVGQWADGHLAYSRCDENGEIIEDEDGRYFQMRSFNGGLFMMGI